MKFDPDVTREKMTRPKTKLRAYNASDYKFDRKRTKRVKKAKVIHAHDVERDQDSY